MKKLTLFATLSAIHTVICAQYNFQSRDVYENFKFHFPEKFLFESLCKPTDYEPKTLAIKPTGCECARNLEAAKDGLGYLSLDVWGKQGLESEAMKHTGMSEEEVKALYLSLFMAASRTNDERGFNCSTYKCTDRNATAHEKFQHNKDFATKKALHIAEAILEHRRKTILPQEITEINGRTFIIDNNSGIEYEKVGEDFYPTVYRQIK